MRLRTTMALDTSTSYIMPMNLKGYSRVQLHRHQKKSLGRERIHSLNSFGRAINPFFGNILYLSSIEKRLNGRSPEEHWREGK